MREKRESQEGDRWLNLFENSTYRVNPLSSLFSTKSWDKVDLVKEGKTEFYQAKSHTGESWKTPRFNVFLPLLGHI